MSVDSTCDSGSAGGKGPGETIGLARNILRAVERPRQIGRYRILRIIGEGGMGTVYEAEQEKPKRTVALKVITPGLASPQLLKRFEQESQVLGRLQHPGIAQIYEAGMHEIAPDSGRKHVVAVPYFAMELIRGRTLKAFVETKRLGTRERLELVAKVCDAVHHAHQKGVIHRDLKPSNILVDESGQPKILDFGVARATDSDIQVTTIHTDVQQLVGTLPYMSPEQVSADPNELDTRSDVYALGVLTYELLAERLPYDLRQKMLHDAVRMIREEEPTPLSTINRVFRGDVETIVAKALEKDKARRYQSAAELAADIRHYLHNEPIVARPASAAYQFKKFAQRHKAVVVGVASVFLVLVAGMIVSTTLYLRAEAAALAEAEQRKQAETSAERARREQVKAERVSGFISDILKGAGPSVALGRDTAMLKEMLNAAAKRIRDGELEDAPEAEVQLRGTIGVTYQELGAYDQAGEMIEPTMEQARRLYGDEHPEVATSLHILAALLESQGKYPEAERLFREVLAMRRKLLGEAHPDVATSLNNLAYVLQIQGNYAEAEPMHREALAMQRKLLGEEHPNVATSLNSLAWVLENQGNYLEAERLYRETLAMRRKLLGEEHPDVATSLNNLAVVLSKQGNYSEAERLYREAMAMWRRLLGEEHPEVAMNLNNLAVVLEKQGNYSEAERLLREALAMRRKLLGEAHPDVATSLNNLGYVLQILGNYAEAEPMHREALAMWRRLLGEEHPNVAMCLNNLAFAIEKQGNHEEAEALARESLRIYEAKLPSDVRRRFLATGVLGAALAGRQQFSEAEPLLLAAHEGLMDRKDVPPIRKRQTVEYIVKLYDSWDAAEPGKGYAAKAAQWRTKLDEMSKSQNVDTPK